jgi:hypothetical protein
VDPEASRDPAITLAVANAIPLLVNYYTPDARITALGSRFLRHIYHLVNGQEFGRDLPQPPNAQS